jgi:hypothetical protein
VSGRSRTSSHGETWSSGRSNVALLKISRAQIICSQVVPHFAGVLITMSPGRNTNPSQRAESVKEVW